MWLWAVGFFPEFSLCPLMAPSLTSQVPVMLESVLLIQRSSFSQTHMFDCVINIPC